MYDLTKFTLSDMTACGTQLRRIGTGARSMEEVARRIVSHLYEQTTAGRDPSCALVRFYVTQPFASLPDELRAFAGSLLGDVKPRPGMKCMTLLGTAGVEPAWNSRHQSAGHKALPLASEDSVARMPMIAQLITQLGVDVAALVAADRSLLVDEQQHTYNVFHVPRALGSPFIPAQADFVRPYGVQSVLGFGGLLPTGDLFATIVFAKTEIPRETAEMFKTLALNVKVAVLPHVSKAVFD